MSDSQKIEQLALIVGGLMKRIDNMEKELKTCKRETWLDIKNKEIFEFLLNTQRGILNYTGYSNSQELQRNLKESSNKRDIYYEYLEKIGLSPYEGILILDIDNDDIHDWYNDAKYKSLYDRFHPKSL